MKFTLDKRSLHNRCKKDMEDIKDILKDKNVTQVELAEKTNVTKQNLSNKMNRGNFLHWN